jgi:hypothetical protein
MRLQASEMNEHRMVSGKSQPTHDMRRLRLGVHALELNSMSRVAYFDAVEHSEEIEVPPGTAEFSVCDTFEPDRFFLGDDLRDFAIFDVFESGRVYRARFAFGAGFLDRCRAQDAADMIGAERRLGSKSHISSPY